MASRGGSGTLQTTRLVRHWNISEAPLIWFLAGKVEGEAQGEDDILQMFMKDIDKGPTHAHVVKLEKSEIEVVDGETGFEVRR